MKKYVFLIISSGFWCYLERLVKLRISIFMILKCKRKDNGAKFGHKPYFAISSP